jgi:hypothetical protein
LNFTLRRYRLLAENGRVKLHVATSKYTKGECKSADGQRMSGADLSSLTRREGIVHYAILPAVLGEKLTVGMIGGIEETSASFEAQSAPRSYPT